MTLLPFLPFLDVLYYESMYVEATVFCVNTTAFFATAASLQTIGTLLYSAAKEQSCLCVRREVLTRSTLELSRHPSF